MSHTIHRKQIADWYHLGPIHATLLVLAWSDGEDEETQHSVVLELHRRSGGTPLKLDQFAICDLPLIEKLLAWAFPRMEEISEEFDHYL